MPDHTHVDDISYLFTYVTVQPVEVIPFPLRIGCSCDSAQWCLGVELPLNWHGLILQLVPSERPLVCFCPCMILNSCNRTLSCG